MVTKRALEALYDTHTKRGLISGPCKSLEALSLQGSICPDHAGSRDGGLQSNAALQIPARRSSISAKAISHPIKTKRFWGHERAQS